MTRAGTQARRFGARFGIAGFAWLCFGACTTPTPAESSSGGEVSDVRVEIGQVETAEDLGRPAPDSLGSESVEVPATESEPSSEPVVTATSDAPAPAPRPTTILAPARSGRLRLSDVHEVIRAQRPDITTCYEEGLSRDSSLSGEAKVRFLIGPQGRIDDAEVYESTLGDETVEACMIGAMRDWRFPRPRPRGTSVLLTYPFLLSTE